MICSFVDFSVQILKSLKKKKTGITTKILRLQILSSEFSEFWSQDILITFCCDSPPPCPSFLVIYQNMLCYSPMAAMDSYHKLGVLKQQTFILLWFWRSEV